MSLAGKRIFITGGSRGIGLAIALRAAQDGALIATGGRVLGIAATGKTLREARDAAYAAVDLLDWPGGFCRRDIGWRALN